MYVGGSLDFVRFIALMNLKVDTSSEVGKNNKVMATGIDWSIGGTFVWLSDLIRGARV